MRTAIATLLLVLAATPASAQTLTTTPIANGLSVPVYVTHAPGDSSRIFIVEKGSGGTGRVRIFDFDSWSLLPDPFLTVTGLFTTGERGLLGMAFHPDYDTNGYFYVYSSAPTATPGQDHASKITRYTVSSDPNDADESSATPVLRFDQPFSNHNAGWLGFGPDGYLYIASGDGGSGNDPDGNGQDITDNLLGTILRIDVDTDDFPGDAERNYAIPADNPFVGVTGDDEIFAFGLRNPWRCAFDSATGDLYIADVGQSAREEINVLPAGTSGQNFGWRCMEGTQCTGLSGCTCNDVALTMPVDQYPHGSTPCSGSVTGGEVYRGCSMPELDGTYFYADYCKNRVWSFKYVNSTVTDKAERTSEIQLSSIVGFGRDAFGEVYVCTGGGAVVRIDPASGIADCNSNNLDDACDIVAGVLTDLDGNGVPDECEPPGCSEADVTTQGAPVGDPDYGIPDGAVTGADLNFYVNFWIALGPLADVTTQGAGAGDPGFGVPDGVVTGADLQYYVNVWIDGCP
jgi:glucose/arabinose dehydrogenase